MKNRTPPKTARQCLRRKVHLRKGREQKYMESFLHSKTNKLNRLKKQVRKHPLDHQAYERLREIQKAS